MAFSPRSFARLSSRGLNYGAHFTTNSYGNEFWGENAYEVLGVLESSTFIEIKASFRKLAKETHPDTAQSLQDPATASRRFVQILAAYEILSDSEKRSHYDQYLLSQRKIIQKQPGLDSVMYRYQSCVTAAKQVEVVEWLRWYRYAINEIVSQKKVVVGSSYMDVLESEFYSAINAAYYGPLIESMDCLPDCFEAEERSTADTAEVLHLVSGRDLFGIVRLEDKVPEIAESFKEKLSSFSSKNGSLIMNSSGAVENVKDPKVQHRNHKDQGPDVYKDLALHISGNFVAFATRVPPKSFYNGIRNRDSQDHIHIFLNLNEDQIYARKTFSSTSVGPRILLGTIAGLGTSPDEGPCDVYSNCGAKTHIIMKHRTLMVKHMHWYQVGDKTSSCECRCSRARMPPSKFWLFEPRCGMHDIGGWYVETFGKDKKGTTVPCQRYCDGNTESECPEKRLHPAMYLMALAYRTLDLEDTKRKKRIVGDTIKPKLFSILQWCKRLV